MRLTDREIDTIKTAADLIACNCSYSADTDPADRCDGTCTHSELLAIASKAREDPKVVYILWGSMPENGQKPSRYELKTQEELDAFLFGVDESNGWMTYDIREDGSPYSDGGLLEEEDEDAV